MEILIGLAIATVAAIGWFYGNLFVCVFLSLGTLLLGGFGVLIASAANADAQPYGGLILLGSVLLLMVIWLPRQYRQGRLSPAH